jgi:hypothetical protein
MIKSVALITVAFWLSRAVVRRVLDARDTSYKQAIQFDLVKTELLTLVKGKWPSDTAVIVSAE